MAAIAASDASLEVRVAASALEDLVTHVLRNAARFRHQGTPIRLELLLLA
ncbi:MAG: hypothetical protein U5L74_00800 [Ideonella sp.]|nr:hypothetical protein [Ideonella sp.]